MMKSQALSLITLVNSDGFGRRKRIVPVCLFGSPDPLDIEKRMEEELLERGEAFLKRWNFNVFTMRQGSEPGGIQWERVDGRKEEEEREDRLVVPTPVPGSRTQDEEAEVNTTCSPVGSRTVRYSPYHKRQKLTDYWRTTKPRSLPQRNSKKSEDPPHTLSQRESPNEH